MLAKIFYVKQLPLIKDVINLINHLIMKERDITIDIGLDDDCYSSVDCSDHGLPRAKIYIKNGEITSIMRIEHNKTSIYNYKKAMIHSKFLSLSLPRKTLFHDKNHMNKEITLDSLKTKQGYYTFDLPLILKHQIG